MNPSSLPNEAPNLLSWLYMLLRMKTKTVFPQSVKHFLQIHGLLQPRTWRSCHRHRPPFPCESYHETAQSWLAGTSPRHSLDQTASPCNRTCPPIWYGDKRRFLSVFLGHLLGLYKEKTSIKDSIPCPAVLSTRTSIWGRENHLLGLPCLGGLTEPAFKLREKPFSKKRDHPVESRYPPVWLCGRAYFPLCYYGAGRQASECDPALHQPVCVWASLLIALHRRRPLSLLYHIHGFILWKLGTWLDSAGTRPFNANKNSETAYQKVWNPSLPYYYEKGKDKG